MIAVAPWISALAGLHLVRGVASAGGDASGFASSLGANDSTQFEDRLPLAMVIDAWEHALAATGRRDLPVLACTRSTHDERSLVGFYAVNQPTVREAFAVLDRYLGTVSDAYAWRMHETEEGFALRLEPTGPIDRIGFQLFNEFESMDIAVIARRVTRNNAVPVAMRYLHGSPPPSVVAEMQRALGIRPVFDQATCELVFPRSIGDIAIEGARSQLAEVVREKLEALLRERDGSVAAQARARVPELIRRKTTTVDALAKAIAMSRRSLERALAKEGTTAAELFDQERLALASAWLPRLTVDEVAARLGYSDARAFARAFRRWTGKSPSDFR
jgi:AraC-like DNA-binding protein